MGATACRWLHRAGIPLARGGRGVGRAPCEGLPVRAGVTCLRLRSAVLRSHAQRKPGWGITMGWLVTKYLLTAAVVVIVSEAAKRSDKLGGFIAALPLVTLLALISLYVEKQPQARIANHAW